MNDINFRIKINLEEYVRFICKHRITQRQYLFLILVYYKRFDLVAEYKKVFPIIEKKNYDQQRMLDEDEKNQLIEMGFLSIKKDSKELNPYIIGEKFAELFIDSLVAIEELYYVYPKFSHKGNFPLLTMSIEDAEIKYINRIGGSRTEHKEILKDIEYGVINNLLDIGVQKFIDSEYWNSLRTLRLQELSVIGNKRSREI